MLASIMRQCANDRQRRCARWPDEGSGNARNNTRKSAARVEVLPIFQGRLERRQRGGSGIRLWSLVDQGLGEQGGNCGIWRHQIADCRSGRWQTTVAQEHAASVLSGLAPIGSNAVVMEDKHGIEPSYCLPRATQKPRSMQPTRRAARSQGRRCRRDCSSWINTALIRWLVDPSLGPPEVAARALSEIALDNPNTQSQIAEEGAISPLVVMVAGAQDVLDKDPAITGRRDSPRCPMLPLAPLRLSQKATSRTDHCG